MNARGLKHVIVFCALMVFLLAAGPRKAAAAPPAPVPISPAAGSTVTSPTFSWQAASGAVKYEVEIGPQSNPTSVIWTMQTPNRSITPADGALIVHGLLYWRVRAFDSANAPGPWSSRINFTKHIPAPSLASPAEGQQVAALGFEWEPAQGAVYYKVELSDSAAFTNVVAAYTTYNTTFYASDTLPHGTYYWRVTGMDADDHAGTPSAARSFTKDNPPPTIIYPINGIGLIIPAFAWQASEGAVTYQVELSPSPSMVPVEETYTTFNSYLVPQATLPNGAWYARVKGVDTDGHIGTQGNIVFFTKNIPAPTLVSPAADAVVTMPTLEWQAVEGAAYYKVELSPNASFIPIEKTLTTYNLQITPQDALTSGDHYWRVSGVDNDDHVGSSNWRKFTLNAAPAPTDNAPQLLTPASNETIGTDPTFTWTRVIGATDYHLIVSLYADFHANYDSPYLDYARYTPSAEGTQDYFANNTYYWKVQARSGTTVIATSEARSFTKQQPLNLVVPADGGGLMIDPSFEWEHFVGADRYRLLVSKQADFEPIYDSIYLDYRSYAPYTPGSYDTYVNGTYYWKVQSLNSSGSVLAESATRSFTKQSVVQLYIPFNEDASLTTDPIFWWKEVQGADQYHLVVSKFANFSPVYDHVYTDYPFYTPSPDGSFDAYPNGTYYWKVEARNNTALIATSAVRSFEKHQPVNLTAPADGSTGLPKGPSFEWEAVIGADSYHLVVSAHANFDLVYDGVFTDYTSYTPYSAGTRSEYADGTYYWKVEARNSTNSVISTSDTWNFSVGATLSTYLPVIRR